MTRRTTLAGIAVAAVALVACGGGSSNTTPTTAGSSATAATTTAAPTTLPPSSKAVAFGPLTLHIPDAWDEGHGDRPGLYGAFGPTIHVKKGYALGRLNVVTFSGKLDDLAPAYCAGPGTSPPAVPSAVHLDERGLAPVGDRTADFGRWTASCPQGPETHRAWLLPVSRILFWETCADPAIDGVVATATVADAPVGTYADVTPRPGDLVPNCDDSDRTDTTTGP